MLLNITLLPISVEVRRRRLKPLRISLLHLMIAVGVAGLFFGLCARLGQLGRAMTYHLEEERKSAGAGPTARLHSDQAMAYHQSYERLDLFIHVAMLAAGALGSIALLGRVLDLMLRRLDTDPDLGPEGLER